MVDAFATAVELGTRLKRTFSSDETEWVTSLLEDASTYLREDIIGAQVFPQATVTFTVWPEPEGIVLPQQPVQAVVSVSRDGSDVDYVYRDGRVLIASPLPVDITFTYGYAEAPEGLKRWTMVLVSQTLISLELNLGLTVGGLSSVALDDFKASFADAGDSTGITLSDRNIELIRSQYGTGVWVTGSR
ncbi:hypothetical protein B7R21_06340 [Subtercola boreus]|uniref:Phage gp6-like head-tail connector protein n=1 Tax=Subtercola boreus TaxID=120213 RepID=A0A3E0VXV5_9MICO|nr:hypothetical protein [Subtercola boreus]RFA14561.1 hypothetical protein B7R21_06340 [Subtercola boreus]